jgi:hypothetical protein
MALAVAIALSGVVPARGEDVVRAPDQIRSCLCQEQVVAALDGQVQAVSRAYEDKRQAFQSLDRQVQQRRPQVNVKSQADVDAFKRLLDQRDQAADVLAGDATNSYADAVARYNQAVASYNGACAGKAYDPDQLAELRRSLSCPKP